MEVIEQYKQQKQIQNKYNFSNDLLENYINQKKKIQNDLVNTTEIEKIIKKEIENIFSLNK